MQLSFGNITMELNIFNIAKQPHNADDRIVDVDLIEVLVDDTFILNLSDDPLQTCLTHFGFDRSKRSTPYLTQHHLWTLINGSPKLNN